MNELGASVAAKSWDGQPPRSPEWDGRLLTAEGDVTLVVIPASTLGEEYSPPAVAAARMDDTTQLVRPSHI